MIGSTAATAFAAVHWDCATGYYSFAHEIGHLQSARHDIATDPSTSPYAYGHGYRYEPSSGSRWRTIMAYNCTRSCPRLNFWSNGFGDTVPSPEASSIIFGVTPECVLNCKSRDCHGKSSLLARSVIYAR